MNHNIRIIGGLTGLKIIGAVLGVIYMVLQVRYFGTSRAIEVFFAAQSVLYVIISLTQSGQLAEIFLPEYLKIRNSKGTSVAHAAYSVVANRLSAIVIIVLCIAFILAPFIIRLFIPGFSTEDQYQATYLFRAFLPFIFLQIQLAFLNTVLNAEQVFGRTEATNIVNGIISILILIFLYQDLEVWALVVSSYVGIIIQIALSLIYAYKKGIRYYFVWVLPSFNHKVFFKTILSTLSYTIATQGLNWAMVASISFLPQGMLAIYKYVEKLYPKLNSILVQPFSTVFFTKISNKISSESDARHLKLKMVNLQEYSLLFGLFIFGLSIAAGKESLSILWKGSNFTSADLAMAYQILCAFFIAFTFQLFYALNRKYSVALGLARYNYNYQTYAQLLSATVAFPLIYFFNIEGLLSAIVFSRLALISVPVYVNLAKGQKFYKAPPLSFSIKFLMGLIFLPIVVLITKAHICLWCHIEGIWFDIANIISWVFFTICLYFLIINLFKLNFIFKLKKEIFGS
ncbi:hypothetical protein GCM10009122_56060 [Fulvivirga kasyanovii]|uniref:Polysaccharide biosynthesis protein n=1 Tax=Fulvivirga kasyanovii TaxID=396812 RepID=A0ABW9RNU2_9BACT|nr:lipid II flippase MurJ [Fulvivirga kasyanovii]MTI24630.1 hypothetical protein [Fulvivirga kasyanovii]